MSDKASICDPVIACYEALASEPMADTCCKRIRVMIQRMQCDKSPGNHELHFITLASQLLSSASSFGIYVVEMYEYIKRRIMKAHFVLQMP